jgi:hypothetical protein
MRTVLTALLALGLTLSARAQDKKDEEPKKELKKEEPPKKEESSKEVPKEEPPAPSPADQGISGRPPLELVVAPGDASAVPSRKGVSWANGGIIDVAQPDPTTIIVTMSGICAVNADLICTSIANYHFELTQGFAVVVNDPKRVKAVKLTMESRVIGLLRTNHQHYVCWTHHCPTADTEPALAAIATCEGAPVVSLSLPPRSAGCCQDLGVYNHEGPICMPVVCGKYVLHETWGFGTTHPCFWCRGASAEFAPQPQYVPAALEYWFQEWHPFNGTATKDFGYQVTIKVTPEKLPARAAGGEELPLPKEDKVMPKEEK